MLNKRYKYAVVIGRFQPVHSGHVALFEYAQTIAKNLIIVVGSANKPSSPKNPFPTAYKTLLLEYATSHLIFSDIHIVHVNDYMYNNQKWLSDVQEEVDHIVPETTTKEDVIVVGHKKDESGWYLNMFPQWNYKEFPNYISINATDIRENLYKGLHNEKNKDVLPPKIYNYIAQMDHCGMFKHVVEEWEFHKKYNEISKEYPRIEHTSDAVVIQSGHILMIQRKNQPGKGLWALPGGFVDQKETVLQSCIRELKEETNIEISEKTLYDGLEDVAGKMFDHPDRDSRGRIITTAFLIELHNKGKLAKVSSGDDAKNVKWLPLSFVRKNTDIIYADHYEIIENMVGII